MYTSAVSHASPKAVWDSMLFPNSFPPFPSQSNVPNIMVTMQRSKYAVGISHPLYQISHNIATIPAPKANAPPNPTTGIPVTMGAALPVADDAAALASLAADPTADVALENALPALLVTLSKPLVSVDKTPPAPEVTIVAPSVATLSTPLVIVDTTPPAPDVTCDAMLVATLATSEVASPKTEVASLTMLPIFWARAMGRRGVRRREARMLVEVVELN